MIQQRINELESLINQDINTITEQFSIVKGNNRLIKSFEKTLAALPKTLGENTLGIIADLEENNTTAEYEIAICKERINQNTGKLKAYKKVLKAWLELEGQNVTVAEGTNCIGLVNESGAVSLVDENLNQIKEDIKEEN